MTRHSDLTLQEMITDRSDSINDLVLGQFVYSLSKQDPSIPGETMDMVHGRIIGNMIIISEIDLEIGLRDMEPSEAEPQP